MPAVQSRVVSDAPQASAGGVLPPARSGTPRARPYGVARAQRPSRLVVYTDGSVYNNGRPNQRCYFAVVREDGQLLKHGYGGPGSVNDGEYQGAVWALTWALAQRTPIHLVTDSQTVERHVSGVNKCTVDRLRAYRDEVRRLLRASGSVLEWRPRKGNLAGAYFDVILKARTKRHARTRGTKVPQ